MKLTNSYLNILKDSIIKMQNKAPGIWRIDSRFEFDNSLDLKEVERYIVRTQPKVVLALINEIESLRSKQNDNVFIRET